jgi:hypothetical protein
VGGQSVTFLSKSKYLAGLQCSKLLWYQYNAKTEIPPVDAATQALFDQGHEVGELAKRLFPGGVEVGKGIVDFQPVLAQSRKALSLRKPLFESAFMQKNAYARADVLDPVGKDQWDIIEVKSSTELKEVNLHDLAFQRYTFEGAGLKIRNCHLLYINTEYVRQGAIDPQALFLREDVTGKVVELLPQVGKNLEGMLEVIGKRKHPDTPIGPHCSDPYDCALEEICWAFLPRQNVTCMHRLGKKAFDLLGRGIQKIVDIPEDYRLSGTQAVQLNATKRGRPFVDREKVGEFLASLEYPLYFLDFETFGTAIPLFDNVRPYQQVPFQFSLHVVRSEGAKPEHHSYLSENQSDPRPDILRQLSTLLGEKGSIIGYSAGFEKRLLRESCDVYRKYLPWFNRVEGRITDLLIPFRSFHYYHPLQEGSTSLKAVLPALTGKGYGGMEISEGGAASLEFLRVTFGTVSEAEREKVRAELLDYCGLDTSGMIQIVAALEELV